MPVGMPVAMPVAIPIGAAPLVPSAGVEVGPEVEPEIEVGPEVEPEIGVEPEVGPEVEPEVVVGIKPAIWLSQRLAGASPSLGRLHQ